MAGTEGKYCPKFVRVKLRQLTPHPQNYLRHDEAQLSHIKASIVRNGFYKNVVLAKGDVILAGHGVCLAAEQMGLEVVPATRLDLEPHSPEALAVLAGDNEIAKLAITNQAQLAEVIQGIIADAEDAMQALEGTGLDQSRLDSLLEETSKLLDGEPESGDSLYTDKVESPVYKVTGDNPPISTLYDTTRTDQLLQQIDKAELPDEVRDFLEHAAGRHTRFDYGQIAEAYAHASPEVQQLMEASALVIIDVDQAIEQGFVRMTQQIAEDAQALEEAVADAA